MGRTNVVLVGKNPKNPKTGLISRRALIAIAVIFFFGATLLVKIFFQKQTAPVEQPKNRTRVYFTPYTNPGRDGTKAFYAGGSGYGFTLAKDHVSYSFIKGVSKRRRPSNPGIISESQTEPKDDLKILTLDVNFIGANPKTRLIGSKKQPGNINLFFGNNPKLWQKHMPTYSQAVYKDLYPGIDLAFSGSNKSIKYDFSIAPQANHKK
ncbi:MAG TPA: hypothetical protein ENH19_03540, partial [Actinobacteria bacterium]|nr:hypothetical protein [Actinomycetes bacterium]HEX21707.1 hypothetical protein [Actinomycetota bacterium]